MDTELIKYMYLLNKDINAVINACATYEDLKAVVAELQVLLSPEITAKDLTAYKFVKLKDLIKNSVIANDLTTFHEYLVSATSTEAIKHIDSEGNVQNWEDPISKLDEAYVYYDSLYSIYYQWMQKYGFLPTTK